MSCSSFMHEQLLVWLGGSVVLASSSATMNNVENFWLHSASFTDSSSCPSRTSTETLCFDSNLSLKSAFHLGSLAKDMATEPT